MKCCCMAGLCSLTNYFLHVPIHIPFDNCCITRSFRVSSLMLVVTTLSCVFIFHLMIFLVPASPPVRGGLLHLSVSYTSSYSKVYFSLTHFSVLGGIFTFVLLKRGSSGLCTDYSEYYGSVWIEECHCLLI